MSELKTFEQLTEDSFEKEGIVSLADRPNQASTFGVGGLTAAELKARFDALPQLIREKLNEIYTALSGEYATQYIALPYKLEWAQKYGSLYDFLLAFASGEISEDLVVISSEGNLSLSAIINNLFKSTNSNKEDLSELKHQINSIYESIRLKQDKLIAGEGIVIQGNVISAPGQSDTAGTIVLINDNFAKEVSFTSDPQTQLDGKADKDNVEAVTRIDVSALPTDSYPLSAMITAEIQQAIQRKPIGASRANIEFYNIPATDETGSYEYWNDVNFSSNCNYFFSDMDDVSSAKYFNFENLKNCNFEGFNIGGTEDLGLVFSNCENIQILNSTITSLTARPLHFENCNELYFENCVFERSSYPFDYEIIFTDNGLGFRWIMFDNCIFSKHEGMTPFDASGVTNTKSLISFSNCHFDDLTKVTKSDVISGSGKVSITATEDEIPTKVSQLENDENFAKKSDLSTVYRYKGSVSYYSELPLVGNEVGDTYNVANSYGVYQGGTNFSWDGTSWDALGGALDLSVFVKKTDYATPTTNGIMLASDKAKLDSVEDYANNYTLPTATGARLGGIIVGENLAVDENGILKGNYPKASTTQAGLMGENDKYYLTWLYSNLGKSYHAFGDVAWRPVEGASVMASVTYTRTGKGVGLLNISLTLNAKAQEFVEGQSGGWMVDITKVENLLSTAMGSTIKFKRGVEGDTSTYYSSIGGTWVRQKETVQTTHHAKARVCGISPFVIIPLVYSASATNESGLSLGAVNASAFEPNETIQMINIPVEEE